MKFLVTSCLDENEKKLLEEKGLYCYELRDSDFGGNIASIEKNVLVNRIGSMVTNKEILLGDKETNNFVDYNEFVSNNEEVCTVEDLLHSNIHKRRQLDNNIYLIDLGYRNHEPIALVERTTQYGKEYIIGFNYKITNNSIEWGYGYYYNQNKNKAVKDFKKVLAGGNLANTFDEKKNKSRER